MTRTTTSVTGTAGSGRAARARAAVQDRFRGRLITPADEEYDTVRALWNGAIDRRPALIARCTDAADVTAALRAGLEQRLPIAVRGGGHGVAGTASVDDGLVLDLSAMRAVRVDPVARTAEAGGGVLWGEFDTATQAHALATTGGIVTHTGIAGLTLGGGLGWLMRQYGLTCDNLLAADLVDAEGQVHKVDAESDPDLLWALRGAGSNFGVVTRFCYRLHPVGPMVLAGPVLFPAEQAREVIACYRELIGHAPDELGSVLNLRYAPALPMIPEPVRGRPVLAVNVCWTGDPATGERVLAPLRRAVEPLADLVALKPYLVHQGTFDATVPHGLHYYWKSEYVAALDDDVVDVLLDHAWASRSPDSYTVVFHLGGAVARTDPATAAFAGRAAGHAVNINAEASDAEAHAIQRAWCRAFWEALRPHSAGVYVNFLGDEGPERVRAAYGEATYARLTRIKTRLDPDNVFRSNQNIEPGRPAPASRTSSAEPGASSPTDLPLTHAGGA
jgi:FAD/FMN-containing dehydrogenase